MKHPFARIAYKLPDRLKPDSAAHDIWRDLHRLRSPYSITDGFLFQSSRPFPDPSDISWCSLHTFAAWRLGQLKQDPPFAPADFGPHWGDVIREFEEARNHSLRAFANFRCTWDPQTPAEQKAANGTGSQNDRETRRILGLHVFQSAEEVERYVHRWFENPDIRSFKLRSHRFILSRAIDLICSELIGNGFIHGIDGIPTGQVAILAKYCPVGAEAIDRKLGAIWHHLAPSEMAFEDYCIRRKCPHLQIVIADTGRGFDGNKALQKLLLARKPELAGRMTTQDLIDFSLSGHASTRRLVAVFKGWRKYSRTSADYEPSIHGLAEVRRCMQSMRGLWRIHTGTTIYEQAFHGEKPETHIAVDTQPFKGVLHYLSIPLTEIEEVVMRKAPGMAAPARPQVRTIELATHLKVHGKPRESSGWLQFQADTFWKETQECGQYHPGKLILINVRALRPFRSHSQEALCALLLNAVAGLWPTNPVAIVGADEVLRSCLRRFTGPNHFLTAGKVLLLLDSDLVSGALNLGLLSDVATQMFERPIVALFAHQDAEIRQSEHDGQTLGSLFESLPADRQSLAAQHADLKKQTAWDCLRVLPERNPHLFRMDKASSENIVKAAFLLNSPDRVHETVDLLTGRLSAADLARMLDETSAMLIPRPSGSRIIRLGETVPFYIHCGRIMSDEQNVAMIRRSLHVQLQSVPGILETSPQLGANLVFVALLHPGIELAHELRELTQFKRAAVVEVRRLSDARWDYPQLLRVVGHRPVIITDVIASSRTIQPLLGALQHLDASPLCICSVLKLGTQAHFPMPHLYANVCSREQLLALAHEKSIH